MTFSTTPKELAEEIFVQCEKWQVLTPHDADWNVMIRKAERVIASKIVKAKRGNQ